MSVILGGVISSFFRLLKAVSISSAVMNPFFLPSSVTPPLGVTLAIFFFGILFNGASGGGKISISSTPFSFSTCINSDSSFFSFWEVLDDFPPFPEVLKALPFLSLDVLPDLLSSSFFFLNSSSS